MVNNVKGKLVDVQPTYERLTITPSIAQKMLAHNEHNRPLSQSRVQILADAMRRGEWQFDGSPIRFDTTGRLLDGQHRLEALSRSDLTFDFAVVRDLKPEVFTVLDTGKSRNGNDALTLAGIKNATTTASALRVYLFIVTGGKNFQYTNTQILEAYEANPRISESFAPAKKSGNVIQAGTGMALHYLFSQHNHDLAEWFFDRLADGVGLSKGEPILTLRNRMMEMQTKGGVVLRRAYVIAIAIKAWNATRRGQTVTLLRWLNDEVFPVPV